MLHFWWAVFAGIPGLTKCLQERAGLWKSKQWWWGKRLGLWAGIHHQQNAKLGPECVFTIFFPEGERTFGEPMFCLCHYLKCLSKLPWTANMQQESALQDFPPVSHRFRPNLSDLQGSISAALLLCIPSWWDADRCNKIEKRKASLPQVICSCKIPVYGTTKATRIETLAPY